jgi:hypothetical protein
MTRLHATTLLALALTSGCGSDDGPTAAADSGAEAADPEVDETNLTVTLDVPDGAYQVVSEPYEVPPHTEVSLCGIVRLDPGDGNDLAWVNAMESMSSEGTHHMNVIIGQFSFLDAFVGEGASETALGMPLGTFPCDDVMEAGFPVFPSQRTNQRITFPAGVAAPLPLPLVAVFNHHYVNATDKPLTINAALNLETIPADEVEHVAELRFDDIRDLEVPPATRQTVTRTCLMDEETNVALVSTHTHEWATCATMNRFDGEQVEDEPFFVNTNWDQPPILHFEPGSFTVPAGEGIHWACHYENATDQTLVNDGTAAGEMCVFAAVTWPADFSVATVQQIVADRDLAQLVELLSQVMGPCDSVRSDIEGPWPATNEGLGGEQTCAGLEQTESNTLD